MTRLAISGHRGLPDDVAALIRPQLTAAIRERAQDGELVGISLLADGPDAWFARAVLEHGGTLIIIVPATEYREGLPAEHHAEYDQLLQQASESIRLSHKESTSRAHMDASVRMLEDAEELIAIWDGEPARGYGGTADVITAARERELPVTVIWPEGATRD